MLTITLIFLNFKSLIKKIFLDGPVISIVMILLVLSSCKIGSSGRSSLKNSNEISTINQSAYDTPAKVFKELYTKSTLTGFAKYESAVAAVFYLAISLDPLNYRGVGEIANFEKNLGTGDFNREIKKTIDIELTMYEILSSNRDIFIKVVSYCGFSKNYYCRMLLEDL